MVIILFTVFLDLIGFGIVIPVLPLMYGMSILYCMSSAMSEPHGAGLGTLGLTVDVFRELADAAGFGSVEIRDFEVDPLNRYFECRP